MSYICSKYSVVTWEWNVLHGNNKEYRSCPSLTPCDSMSSLSIRGWRGNTICTGFLSLKHEHRARGWSFRAQSPRILSIGEADTSLAVLRRHFTDTSEKKYIWYINIAIKKRYNLKFVLCISVQKIPFHILVNNGFQVRVLRSWFYPNGFRRLQQDRTLCLTYHLCSSINVALCFKLWHNSPWNFETLISTNLCALV